MDLDFVPGGRAGGTKGADAETLSGGLDPAKRVENRGNLGRAIHLIHLLSKA